MKTFIIIAHRSGMSMFGAATRPLRNLYNEVLTFATREEAEKHRDRLTADLKTANVHYTVEEGY